MPIAVIGVDFGEARTIGLQQAVLRVKDRSHACVGRRISITIIAEACVRNLVIAVEGAGDALETGRVPRPRGSAAVVAKAFG